MNKISTPSAGCQSGTPSGSCRAAAPRQSTVDFLRQFARAYQAPAASMPGLVLN